MEIRKINKKALSSDGKHVISGVVYIPEGEVKGLFHVVHGMTEYIGRYEKFMLDMAQEGFIVFGYDHLGHGKTAAEKGDYGFIAHKDGWKYLVNDVAVFGRSVKKQYGEDLPYILFGHSMGSFIVRIAAAHFDLQDKLIVMGTGAPNPAVNAGLAFLRGIKTAKGERFISAKAEQLAFGSYNDGFEGEREHRWLSNDDSVVEAYENDPLCSFKFTVSAMEDLLILNRECNAERCFAAYNASKPILLISGSDDPVGDYGAGVRAVYDGLKNAGADVYMKIYEGYRHELLNDSSYNETLEDIKAFIRDGKL